VLQLLATTLGFQGVPGAGPNALAAPQAALISALAKGVLGGNLNWGMLGAGAAIGVIVVIADEALGRLGLRRLPPLGVGLGVYLPMSVTLPVVVGSVIGAAYERWAERTVDAEFARRMGVLTATGMIVGESLWGVVFAIIVYLANAEAPLAIAGPGFAPVALVGGTIVFLVLVWGLYRYTRRLAVPP
jgi:putative OPT family oligopeptide transporter